MTRRPLTVPNRISDGSYMVAERILEREATKQNAAKSLT